MVVHSGTAGRRTGMDDNEGGPVSFEQGVTGELVRCCEEGGCWTSTG